MRCSVDETGFTESLRAGNIPVGSGFSPRSQWKFTSLAPIMGWIKNVSTQGEGEKKAKLNPSNTPPPWLRRSSLQVKPKLAGLSPRCLGDGHLLPLSAELPRVWAEAAGEQRCLAELLVWGSRGKCGSRCWREGRGVTAGCAPAAR